MAGEQVRDLDLIKRILLGVQANGGYSAAEGEDLDHVHYNTGLAIDMRLLTGVHEDNWQGGYYRALTLTGEGQDFIDAAAKQGPDRWKRAVAWFADSSGKAALSAGLQALMRGDSF